MIEHTADKAIRAYGEDLQRLFENAAYGMFSLMADLAAYEGEETRPVSAEGSDVESLLRAWLGELLFMFEVERVLPVEFRVNSLTDQSVSGEVRVLPFDRGIEWLGSIVKAVTYHDLDIHNSGGVWEATIVLDV